ncbi:VolA/Pla-1 family phospholipase [Alteromonas lipolytica]|uniref:Bacterial virulence factor lipase N-terminal domain-containing protein n=1 Tax=Alteromonas lipolytica TaxID=1856405 RepID=A0A1E8FGQ4_9ALTE|nr:VolA/Pla-1 family phospholipase [Alteromonas lipolytica]OFI35094.1 hypothetical protein BFC17_16230 [Alteromonas lipolytica]GGF56593.1 lipase [Alteromonas lipolytica]
MKKLILSTSVALALGLAGCGGGESIEDINNQTEVETPFSRIVFDPANGDLNIPNDLLMLPGDDGFFDYTLNIPVADPSDFGDPQNALNIIDGWSIQHPFAINVDTAAGVALDASTLSAGILLFEATLGLDQSDPDCADAAIPSSGCKLGDQLTYGVDYVLSLADDNTVNVVPLKPLKPAKGHMLVMTTALKDTSGKAVQGSTTWDLVRQDISTSPLATEDQLTLQTLVNSYITPLLGAGFEREEITYVAAFTTQSTFDVMSTLKQLMVADLVTILTTGAGNPASALPVIQVQDATGPDNAMEALNLINDETLAGALSLAKAGQSAQIQAAIDATDFSLLQTCDGIFGTLTGQLSAYWGPMETVATGLSQSFAAEAGPFCAAQRYTGSVSLPYYSAVPSMTNPLAPVNDFWHAACDSGIVLAGAPAEVLGAATPGPNYALCSQAGLADLRFNGEMLDSHRNLTRFSPIPQVTVADNQLDVQVTTPDPVIATALGFPISKPADGWPVAILVHGITSKKEDMLAITGTLALHGIASIAIDLPLHGSRGFDVDGDGTDDLNASSVSATHYMNLGTLPVARDNLRQGMADLLGLRLGLNAVADLTASQAVDLDSSNVSVMGVSLGAISSANFAALANSTLGNPVLDAMFAVKAASLESAGSGIANFLLESPRFGPLIKALLLSESSDEFVAYVGQTYGADATEAQLAQAYVDFTALMSAEQAAAAAGLFSQFIFAAQTILDAADPSAYAATLGANTPVHFMSVVGDGGTNLPDQVIPVDTALPLSGQNPLAAMIGLQQVSSTISLAPDTVSGQVRFTSGGHGSSLSPVADAAVTREMQLEVGGYFKSNAQELPITNEAVVAN